MISCARVAGLVAIVIACAMGSVGAAQAGGLRLVSGWSEYDYEATAAVEKLAEPAATSATTPTTNALTEAIGARAVSRAALGVVRLASDHFLAAKAGRGGAGPVRVGQAGEAAVRGAYDIGPKATRVVNGRARIFDGLTDDAVSEVKNVKSLSYTQQLKDSQAFAQQSGRRFDLYVRGGPNATSLSGPLAAAIRNGDIGLRYIP